MYRLLIADDELLMRKGLARIFSATGMFSVDTAENGAVALQLIREGDYDAVLLDIVMPKMSGLEVLEAMEGMNPVPIKIIISGYNLFEYAQQAITYGVSDFLLKPVTPEMAVTFSEKLAVLIDGRRSAMEREKQAADEIERAYPLLRERFLERLASSRSLDEDLSAKLKYYSVDFPFAHFQAAVVVPVSEGGDEQERHIKEFSIAGVLNDHATDNIKVEAFRFSSGQIGVILNLCDPSCEEGSERLFSQVAKEIQSLWFKEFSGGVGGVYSGLEGITRSFHEAQDACDFNRVTHSTSFLFYKDMNEIPKGVPDNLDYRQAVALMKAGQWEELVEQTRTILSESEANKHLIFLLTVKLVLACHEVADSAGLVPDEDMLEKVTELLVLRPAEGGQGVLDVLPDLMRHVSEAASGSRREKYNYLIERGKQIIRETLSTEISVADLADKLGISRGYFGKLFKSIVGISVSSYVNNLRIEEAMRLLSTTTMKVNEVGHAVGYANPHYFFTCFKQIVGVSPTEFRNQL